MKIDEEEALESWASAFNYGPRLQAAWVAFRRWLPVLFVGGFLRICTQGPGGNPANLTDLRGGSDVGAIEATVVLVVAAIVIVLALFLFALNCWITPGWNRALLRSASGEEPTFSDLFGGSDRFFAQAGATIIKALVLVSTFLPTLMAAGVVAAIFGSDEAAVIPWLVVALVGLANLIPFVWVSLGLVFTDVVLAVEGRGPLAALARSWELADGHRFYLFLFLFLSGVVGIAFALLGYCMLCIGIFFTAPIALALNEHAFVDAYARAVGLRAAISPAEAGQAGVQSAESPWDAPPS